MERNDPTNNLLEAPSFRVGRPQFTQPRVMKHSTFSMQSGKQYARRTRDDPKVPAV